jgi:glyoxylase-like metal-dependent hydrolase (beta-lactamase superfamily II)
VVVTHAHWDHSFGTAAFLPADVWAHVDCRTELIAHGYDQRAAVAADYAEAGRAAEAEHVSAVEPVPPNRLLTGRAELTIGGRLVALAHLGPGHTGHDVVVHVPDAGVVFAGDLVEQGAPPAFEDSFPLAWPATVDGIVGLAPRVVVPGHGAPVDVSFVTTQRDELTAVATACADMIAGRSSWADAVLRSPYPPNVLGVAIDRVRSTHPEAGKPPIQGHHVRPNGR